MKQYQIPALILLFVSVICFSCKKDLYQANVQLSSSHSISLTSNVVANQSITLSEASDSAVALILSWTDPHYFPDTARGNVIVNYVVDMDTSSTFQTCRSYNIGASIRTDSLKGSDLNNKLSGIGCTPGIARMVYARVRSIFYGDTVVSNTVSFNATAYSLPLPALLMIGENGWVTPATRTNGYLLTSANKDNKYEGYVNFSYASYGGTNCKLLSTIDNSGYGWGNDAYTLQKAADISSVGNLWITPAPNYMKVDVDVNALTISYVPIKFYIAGSNNGWSTSATPMTFDATTNKWTATVTFSAGDVFDFISSTWDATTASWQAASWDISYKMNSAGSLVYSGSPTWGGIDIPVAQAGTYTVTLDLSGGDGNYTYSIK